MQFRGFLCAFVAALAVSLAGPALASERIALVIGNSGYRHVTSLANADHDAAAMAQLFRKAGFTRVELHRDLGIAEMRRVLRDFSVLARSADVAAIYFAGHGIEVDGANHLIPVDARLATDFDVEDETLSLDRLLRAIEPARRLRLVILDACRDNPFAPHMKRMVATRSVGRGLARVEVTTSDTLIAFAAQAGAVAADGSGTNSPYTAALVQHLATPGLDLRLAFGRVRDAVLEATGGRQEPFVYGSLGGRAMPLVAAPLEPAPAPAVTAPVLALEDPARQDYELAERVGTAAAWEVYLGRHPNGFLADLARAHLARLGSLAEPPAQAVVPDEQGPLSVAPAMPPARPVVKPEAVKPAAVKPAARPPRLKKREASPKAAPPAAAAKRPQAVPSASARVVCGPRGCTTVPPNCRVERPVGMGTREAGQTGPRIVCN